MKLPFKRTNPAEALKATEAALAETESKIRGLGEQRLAKLVESDGVDEVAAIDRQIEVHRQTAGIHRDRIKALHGEVAHARLEELQTEREARVAATEKLLGARDATGLRLENAIHDVGKLYFELIDQNLEIAKLWGFSNNARRVGALGESIIAREVSHSMFAAGRPHQGRTRFPSPGTVGLGVIGMDASGTLGERIAATSAALLEMIRAVPVPQPEQNEAA